MESFKRWAIYVITEGEDGKVTEIPVDFAGSEQEAKEKYLKILKEREEKRRAGEDVPGTLTYRDTQAESD